ncbi:hypothetical protein BN2497_5439 [Janthinobacterium sp. CG23_2]|nr:hypothetical protein BN2497_5439 [Janthinobacterium sp. CG23_2]CUU29117.1 hypothetical protein BN3177_5439 [Janthinobacterium sp. CG23_2]
MLLWPHPDRLCENVEPPVPAAPCAGGMPQPHMACSLNAKENDGK